MIRRIHVDNYKSLVDFELQLDELTLLVGENGAGKTAVLDVIDGLSRLFKDPTTVLGRDVFPASSCTRWNQSDVQRFGVDVEIEGEQYVYELIIRHDQKWKSAVILKEEFYDHLPSSDGIWRPKIRNEKGEINEFNSDGTIDGKYRTNPNTSGIAVLREDSSSTLEKFRKFMRHIFVGGFAPHTMVSESSEEEETLQRDGSNFASWYRHVSQERQDLVFGYIEELKHVFPLLKGLRLERVGVETRALMVIFEEDDKRYELRFDELSEGQRVLLILHALIALTVDQGYTLFLDEPVNYVGLREIQPWLVALREACEERGMQAVLCSHHPEIIDYLGSDAGILLARAAKGVTKVKRISELPWSEGPLDLSEVIARGWDE